MADRVMSRPEGVRITSPWPYDEMPEKKTPGRNAGTWILAISTDEDLNGLVTYYPKSDGVQRLHIDNGTLYGKKITTKPFYRVASREEAEKFCVTFCSRGYDRAESLLPHQDGTLWGFNWSSLTNATVVIASQVADHFFNDRYDKAWEVGRAFGEEIRKAENAAWDAARAGAK